MNGQAIIYAAACGMACAVAATTRAGIVLDSASRSVQGGTTFTGFGMYSDSQSGTGFAPPNGTGAWSAQQTSNITTDGVAYTAVYGASVQGGGGQVEFAGGNVGFTFAFDVTGAPQMISYSWSGYFANAPTLTDPSSNHISLNTNGVMMEMTLPVGHYSFTASDYVQTFAQLPVYTEHASGTISFTPAPGTFGLLGLGGLAAARRRR